VQRRDGDERTRRVAAAVIAVAAVVAMAAALYPAWNERAGYAHQDGVWIDAQRVVDRSYVRDVIALADEAEARGDGRVWAGQSDKWGHDYRVGAARVNGILQNHDIDTIGNTLRVAPLMDNVEPRFDQHNLADYELFGIKYLIMPEYYPPKVPATKLDQRGPHVLWEVDTSGYLDVVDTVKPPIRADRTNIGKQTKSFLDSTLLRDKKYPTVAYDGDRAARATAGNGDRVEGAAGTVVSQYQHLENGTYGGVVEANRRAVVLLKSSFNPRWKVTVDGKPATTQMVAPALVGVTVPPGRHRIEFQYQPFQHYVWLFLLGAATLVVLAIGPRWWARRKERRHGHA
jgi:hypothetical protein